MIISKNIRYYLGAIDFDFNVCTQGRIYVPGVLLNKNAQEKTTT